MSIRLIYDFKGVPSSDPKMTNTVFMNRWLELQSSPLPLSTVKPEPYKNTATTIVGEKSAKSANKNAECLIKS